MVFKAILFAAGVATLLIAYFSPAPVTATGLRSTMPVRTATTGRQLSTRATTHGTFSSVRATTTRPSAAATAGSVFALSKGSPNSERT